MSASFATTSARKDIKRNKLWTRRIVFAFFIFVGLVVLLESPLTRIRQIVVTGKGVLGTTVIADSGLRKGMSLWQVSAGVVTHQIKAQEPLVQSVSVHTDYLAGTVNIKITEKSKVAVLEQAGHLYSLLNDGTVYQSVNGKAVVQLPLVLSPSAKAAVSTGTVATVPGLVTLCNQLSQVTPAQIQGVSQFVLNQYGDVSIYLDDGFTVQTEATQVKSTLNTIVSVVNYFSNQGYGPGLIDMTGQPPYRYTPFAAPNKPKQSQSK